MVIVLALSCAYDPSQARPNKNSVPYDPLTLKYNDSKDGQRLMCVSFLRNRNVVVVARVFVPL